MAENTLLQLINDATRRLAANGESARLDAEILLAHALGRPRTWLRAHADEPTTADAAAAFERLVQRRLHGDPVAYLVGRREFWSMDLAVTPGVLIPRPDTETLVAAALEIGGGAASVADLGTGTGAIALALAQERPQWRIVATDIDPVALELASGNAAALGLGDRVTFLDSRPEGRSYDEKDHRGSDPMVANNPWYAAIAGRRFDLIVSNPPYIAEYDPHLNQGDVRFEPRAALVSGIDGLDDIGAIIASARDHLNHDGWLLLEHGYDQATAVADLMEAAGFGAARHWRDLGGHVRVTGARTR